MPPQQLRVELIPDMLVHLRMHQDTSNKILDLIFVFRHLNLEKIENHISIQIFLCNIEGETLVIGVGRIVKRVTNIVFKDVSVTQEL